MTAKDVIRAIMAEEGYSQRKLAEACGMKRQSNVTGVLNRYASLRVDILEQMVSAMGYEVVIRRTGEDAGGYVIHEETRNGDDTTPVSE